MKCLVKNGELYSVEDLDPGSRPNIVCVLPESLTSEDIKYINVLWKPGQVPEVTIDWAQKKADTPKKSWNDKGFLERFTDGFKRED